jgi:hypothetical protein
MDGSWVLVSGRHGTDPPLRPCLPPGFLVRLSPHLKDKTQPIPISSFLLNLALSHPSDPESYLLSTLPLSFTITIVPSCSCSFTPIGIFFTYLTFKYSSLYHHRLPPRDPFVLSTYLLNFISPRFCPTPPIKSSTHSTHLISLVTLQVPTGDLGYSYLSRNHSRIRTLTVRSWTILLATEQTPYNTI